MARASIHNMIRKQLSDLRKQIAHHEKMLKSLRSQEKNILQAVKLLGGKVAAGSGFSRDRSPAKGKAEVVKRSRRTNWDHVVNSLPEKFTMNDLAATSGARGKSRAYLHQIINRWKKAGVIQSVGRATYQKM